MATNSQLSATESKKQTKQTTRTGTESQIWRSFGGLSAGRGKGENERKGTGNKKHNQLVQNRQGEVKNSIGNREAKELISTIHGHELRWGLLEGRQVLGGGRQRGKNWDNYRSIINKIYFKNYKRNNTKRPRILRPFSICLAQ